MYRFICISSLALAACSPAPASAPAPAPPGAHPTASAPKPQAAAAPVQPSSQPAAAQPPADPIDARVAAINAATFVPVAAAVAMSGQPPAPTTTAAKPAPDDLLIRVEALLGRARFSPGVVDGLQGSNLDHALASYRGARAIQAGGALDAATWQALLMEPGGGAPVAAAYVVTAEDIAGPFAPAVGENFVKLAALPQGPQFATPLEALAERFHMSQALLKALNPSEDFKTAGKKIVVIDAAPPSFQKGDVASVEISKDKAQAVALDKDGKVLAFYPATVGSTERPSPSGVHKVNGVAEAPDYVYDPKKLNWGPRAHGKLVIKPGPNGPVGTVWIDLNAPSYGIHGSPDPETIGKTASHGCVRLTNWDAEALAAGVKPGVKVTFEGSRKKG